MDRAPGTASRIVLALIWLVLGAAMLATTTWIGWTRWEPVLSGHPAMLALTIVNGLVGVVAMAWAIASLVAGARQDAWAGPPGRQHLRTSAELQRLAQLRIALAVPALLVCLVTVIALAWARPIPATADAVAATRSRENVKAGETLTWYELTPTREDDRGRTVKPTAGLVFIPAARVDPRAYAKILAPLAEAGYLVIVLREPFNLAAVDPRHAGRAMAARPGIGSWVVAGHGLGGRVAAEFADSHPKVKGLVLWGSRPRAPLQRTDLRIVSVYGTADVVTTTEDVTGSQANLPASTTYVPVAGAVHGFFGDYEAQPGDGIAAVDRETAQEQIREATKALLAAVNPPPPPKKK